MIREALASTSTSDTPLDLGETMMGEIDLNVVPEDGGDDSLGQENEPDLPGQENELLEQENGAGADTLSAVNARKNILVTIDKRRAIFDALLGRARNGSLKSNDTKEVSDNKRRARNGDIML